MTDMRKFGDIREKALIQREEGLAEGVAELKGASLDRRVDFLREVPGAKGDLLNELLADIHNLKKGQGLEAAGMIETSLPASRPSVRQGSILVGIIVGLITGMAGGVGGTWMMLAGGQGKDPPALAVVQVPVPKQAPVSRWASSEEEDLYLRLSRSNGGMALETHCREDGRVEVETPDGRRNACLIWPPVEVRYDEGSGRS